MTTKDLKRFREILMVKRAELGNAFRSRESLAIETSPEELDRVQNAVERDMTVGNLERASGRLHDVQAALGRIDVGTFGTCLECEQEISVSRLTAVPWTRSCITCQEASDRALGSKGSLIGWAVPEAS